MLSFGFWRVELPTWIAIEMICKVEYSIKFKKNGIKDKDNTRNEWQMFVRVFFL